MPDKNKHTYEAISLAALPKIGLGVPRLRIMMSGEPQATPIGTRNRVWIED